MVTLDPRDYPDDRVDKTEKLIERMKKAGFRVCIRERMHEHFTLIDGRLVWYGSINFLSRAKEDDSLIRIEDREVAQELMEITFSLNKKSEA